MLGLLAGLFLMHSFRVASSRPTAEELLCHEFLKAASLPRATYSTNTSSTSSTTHSTNTTRTTSHAPEHAATGMYVFNTFSIF